MSTDGNDWPGPVPVPELRIDVAPSTGPAGVVSDEERNRYGVLLDHAAERGLLSMAEYQVRLAELADASSVDELQRIVTELPAFGGPGVPAPAPAPDRPSGRAGATSARSEPDPTALDPALWANLTPAKQRRGSGGSWTVLVVVVMVLLAAMVVLAVVADHVAHTHQSWAPAGGPVLSRLRL